MLVSVSDVIFLKKINIKYDKSIQFKKRSYELVSFMLVRCAFVRVFDFIVRDDTMTMTDEPRPRLVTRTSN